MKYNFDITYDRHNTYSTQWDFIKDRFGRNDLLPFSISDTDFIIPYEVTEVLKNSLELPIYGYTRWNHDDYKSAICNYFNRRFNSFVDPNWITYSPSVMYALSSLMQILTHEGDTVVTFAPMYTDFEDCTLITSRIMERVYLKDCNGYYHIDFNALEKALAKAKVFLLCSPHNPTGRIWTYDELSTIVSLCKKYNVSIISDEIHMDIQLKGKHIPITSFINEYANIYLVSSGSKTFNYPGLGGSYCFISNDNVKETFMNYTRHRDFVNSANYMGMLALMTSYNLCDDYVDELVSYIKENMNIVDKYIKENIPELSFKIPEATYLAWIDTRKLPYTSKQIQESLINNGKVAIMNGDIYFGNGYIRMNVGCPKTKLLEGLKRLEIGIHALTSYKK